MTDAASPERSARTRQRVQKVLGAIVGLVIFAVIISYGHKKTLHFTDLQLGQCAESFDVAGQHVSNLHLVDCSKSHQAEVYRVGTTTGRLANEPVIIEDQCEAKVGDALMSRVAAAKAKVVMLYDGKAQTGAVVCVAVTAARVGSFVAP